VPSRIVILSGVHLCHNPRVFKEATTLARAGYEVYVLGAWFDPELKRRDQDLMARASFRFLPVADAVGAQGLEGLRDLAGRGRAKIGNLLRRYTGVSNTWQFGRLPGAMLQAARRIPGDLYLSHLEPAMLAARELLADGRRVGIDMEDWYSEDLLLEARQYRPLSMLRELETNLLLRSVYSTCPSQAMSGALAQEFGCRPPQVIYNAFPLADREHLDGRTIDRRDPRALSICWFSQTIGPGRGLEDLFAALPLLHGEVEVHLRGKAVAGVDAWLAAAVPEGHRQRIFLHDLVANQKLLPRIAEHDVGFAGEMKFCRSRELTVTNKFFQYLLAGIAVVASDTDGQKEIAGKAPGAVHLYEGGRPASLAAQLNRLQGSVGLLASSKAAALKSAQEKFCWDRQEGILLESIEGALR